MRKFIHLKLALGLLLMLAWSVKASTFWIVSTNINPGSSDANNGLTSNTAWATPHAVCLGGVHTLVGGDVLNVVGPFDGGVSSKNYFTFLTGVGTSNSQIIITNGCPILCEITNCPAAALRMNGNRWVTVTGFNLHNNFNNVNCSGVVNCTFANYISTTTTNSPGFVLTAGSVSNYFTNWTMTNFAGPFPSNLRCTNGDGGSDNFYEGNYQSTTDGSGANIYENGVGGYCGHAALELAGTNSLVVGSTFYNPAWYQALWYQTSCNPIGSTSITNTLWWGGRVISLGGKYSGLTTLYDNHFCMGGLVADQPPIVHMENAFGCLIAFNDIYGAAACGIEINNQGGFLGGSGSNIVENNSITQCGYDWTWNTIDGSLFQITYAEYNRWLLMAGTSNNIIINNAVFNNRSDTYQFNDLPSAPKWFAGNLIGTDPLWANTNGSLLTLNPTPPILLDFHVASNSPAIAAGVWPATISSTGGTGTTFNVSSNAQCFFPGQTAANRTIPGWTIAFQGTFQQATITSISGNTITVDHAVTWVNGQGIARAGFQGPMPDAGEFPFNGMNSSNILTLNGIGNASPAALNGTSAGPTVLTVNLQ